MKKLTDVEAELALLNQVRELVNTTPYWRKIPDAKLRKLFAKDQQRRGDN